jgi:hypothetical protein
VFANWELVFLTSAAIDDGKGARTTARSRSVGEEEEEMRMVRRDSMNFNCCLKFLMLMSYLTTLCVRRVL